MSQDAPITHPNGRRTYPPAHSSCWSLTMLYRDENAPGRALRASSRLLQFAAGLEPGAHLSLVLTGDGSGEVAVRLHTDTTKHRVADHLPWITEGVGTWAQLGASDTHLVDPAGLGCLFELVPAVQDPAPAVLDVDFLRDGQSTNVPASRPDLWPVGIIDDGMELLQALTGVAAQVRVHMAPATLLEQQLIAAQTRTSVQSNDPVAYAQYMGTPLRVRCFAGQAGDHLSPRLRAALMRFGIGLALVPRSLDSFADRTAWDGDELSLSGAVQPYGVAQCLTRLPASGEKAVVCGVATGEPDAPLVPLTLTGSDARGGLRLGTAVSPTGGRVEVRVEASDLLLHTQVLGATGTGKSTLLAGLVQEATAAGMGVSVIDPHGALLERIVDELPPPMAERTVVVRSGDLDNPVPLNVLRGPRSEMVGDMMVEVLRELFDPQNQGFLGPRFERAYATALGVLRVLFGDRASLSAIPLVYRGQDALKRLEPVVRASDPALADVLVQEFIRLRPEEYADITAWVNAKFQRLVATPEMRALLGSGEDAVDVARVIDRRELLLVDLALPVLGPLGAQLLGEMWLAKHWQALGDRRRPDQPHLVIVDEAHLFASGLLPRLLAEARKFGVGVVLAHQHLEQLQPVLREATLATTSNVIVFRSGPREAGAALTRLGDWAGSSLTRLPRFQAAATLSQGVEQSDAFTLVVDHNQRVDAAPRDPSVGDRIDAASRTRYVTPFRRARPIDAKELDAVVRDRLSGGTLADAPARARTDASDFLDDWLAKRRQGAPVPDGLDLDDDEL